MSDPSMPVVYERDPSSTDQVQRLTLSRSGKRPPDSPPDTPEPGAAPATAAGAAQPAGGDAPSRTNAAQSLINSLAPLNSV